MKKKILFLLLLLVTSLGFGVIAYANTPCQISKTSATMEVDSKLKLYITKTSSRMVQWFSNDDNIASVSKWGTVIGVSEGKATITAVVNEQTYTCNITVVNSNVEEEIQPNIYSQLEENKLPETKTFMTIGIGTNYIDVNDSSYKDGILSAYAVISYSNIPDAYITGISYPTSETIRFHFNKVIGYKNTLVIEYSANVKKNEADEKEVDLAIFMGQSNASGVGIANLAPSVPSYMGSEFRAISDPTTLYDICEPFGVNENKELGINDRNLKTGSLVSAFVNSYYGQTGRKLICVSASQGATSIANWQPDSTRLKDGINRFQTALTWLNQNGYTVKNKFVVWLQGETDGGLGTSKEEYTESLKKTINAMLESGADNFYIIRIGNNKDNENLYKDIISAQTELCKDYRNTILVSTKLCIMNQNDMMKDAFHYTQQGYNIVGYDAGTNVAYHILTGKEPTMYDYEYRNIYRSNFKLFQ